jgi:hypothetical protein
MAGYVIGLGFLAFTTWLWWDNRFPRGAVPLTGTVLEEVSRKSTQTGRNTYTYGPRVSYIHPRTGAEAVLEPVSFTQSRYTVGEQVLLAYLPDTDRVTRPDPSSVAQLTLLVLVGVGFLLAGWFG